MLAVIGVVLMFIGSIYDENARWLDDEKGSYIFLVGLFMLLFNLE